MTYSLGSLEAAGVGFGGAFVGTLGATGDTSATGIVHALIVGAITFFASLGYSGYQASKAA